MNGQHGYYDPTQDSTPLPQMEVFPHGEAARKARRAFTYAAVIFGLAGFAAGAAFGETIQIGRTLNVNGSAVDATTLTIEPSTEPGQLAVVTLDNAMVNDAGDNAEYHIGIPGLAVGVTFTWDVDGYSGADQITVFPPEGITCIPGDCTATVMEGMTGAIVLLDWIGG
jgi:hypothetical protein